MENSLKIPVIELFTKFCNDFYLIKEMYSSKNTNQFSMATENSQFDDIFIFIFIIRYHHIFFLSYVC